MPVVAATHAPVFERHGVRFTGLTSPSRGATENSVWRFEVAPGGGGHAHRLTREETFVTLEGTATIQLDGVGHTLQAGDAVAVPAGVLLQLANPSAEPFRGLAVLPVGGQVVIDGAAAFVPPWAA